jgi:predicted transcriptional regulator
MSKTLELDDDLAVTLRRIAAERRQTELQVVREALAVYAETRPPLPKGVGQHHSGESHTAADARTILRKAAKDGVWP